MRALILTAIIALVLPAAFAHANDCRGGARSSLAGPQTPCAQRRPAAARAVKQERGEPKLPPGTFRSGNTTITVRGYTGGEVTTRAR